MYQIFVDSELIVASFKPKETIKELAFEIAKDFPNKPISLIYIEKEMN